MFGLVMRFEVNTVDIFIWCVSPGCDSLEQINFGHKILLSCLRTQREMIIVLQALEVNLTL